MGVLQDIFSFKNTEFFSPKLTISNVTTDARQFTSSFVDQRSVSIITNSPDSVISSKKDSAISQTPTQSIIPTISPFIGAGAGSTGSTQEQGSLSRLTDVFIVGALVTGGIILIQGLGKKKK